MTTKNVLEEGYVEPERPYSQNELQTMRMQLHNKFRLSKVEAYHTHCGHFYKVRKNGRKEKEILETKNNDIGNCSVCWKLNKVKDKFCSEVAKDLIYDYSRYFYDSNVDKKFLSHYMVSTENTFYNWLYEDTRERQKKTDHPVETE